MTPYRERKEAGYYDPKPVKTTKAERDTTTDKLSGITPSAKTKGKQK